MMKLQAAKSVHTEKREEEQERQKQTFHKRIIITFLVQHSRIPNVLSKKKVTVM